MANVEIRPGDTLSIVWSSVQKTPFGSTPVESSFAFSYEDILGKLQAKGRSGRTRKLPTEGVRLSRVVALSLKALKTGKWATGSEIDKDEVFDRLVSQMNDLHELERKNITPNAKRALLELYKSKTLLKANQKNQLKDVLETVIGPLEK
jgi:hypothetical protein